MHETIVPSRSELAGIRRASTSSTTRLHDFAVGWRFACVAMSRAPRVVKCPQCGTPVPWSPESRWRPFCSERCKMLDLGAWASERYRVETTEAPESSDAMPEQPDER
jgi:endogenous inhibitor of DNA gyrase (YacG/DUF329 family)